MLAKQKGAPSLFEIAEFLVPTGSFFHAQTPVSFHIREELSPNVREIHFSLAKNNYTNEIETAHETEPFVIGNRGGVFIV